MLGGLGRSRKQVCASGDYAIATENLGDYPFGHLQYAGITKACAAAVFVAIASALCWRGKPNISNEILQALEIGHEAVVLVFVCLGVDHAEDRGGMNGD